MLEPAGVVVDVLGERRVGEGGFGQPSALVVLERRCPTSTIGGRQPSAFVVVGERLGGRVGIGDRPELAHIVIGERRLAAELVEGLFPFAEGVVDRSGNAAVGIRRLYEPFQLVVGERGRERLDRAIRKRSCPRLRQTIAVRVVGEVGLVAFGVGYLDEIPRGIVVARRRVDDASDRRRWGLQVAIGVISQIRLGTRGVDRLRQVPGRWVVDVRRRLVSEGPSMFPPGRERCR